MAHTLGRFDPKALAVAGYLVAGAVLLPVAVSIGALAAWSVGGVLLGGLLVLRR